jgi:Tol biopolymer transport system component
MIDERERLEEAFKLFDRPEPAWERLIDRRERNQRNRRIRAGALGIILALATGIVLVRSLTSDGIPADQPVEPRPTPVASGALAYRVGVDIYVADPDGSNPVKIADAGTDAGCEGMTFEAWVIPSWSPDGKYLAFERSCADAEHDDVVIIDPHGNVVGEVRTYGGGWGFTWSPDSTRVAVLQPDLTTGVYGVHGERVVSFPPEVINTERGTSSPPAWTPDGSALFDGYGRVVPLDGGPPYEFSLGGRVTYSPDGTRLAVETGHSLAFYDGDRSLVSEARLSGVEDTENGWSPGGDRFAVLADREINVIDVGSGTVTVATEARAALDHGERILGIRGFSPKGDRILYATGDVVGDWNHIVAPALWSISVDGSDPQLVVAGTTQGQWRPR